MAEFSRDEMEEMVQRWLEANKLAEMEGNWAKNLGPMYTEDAEYHWNIGPNEEFVAHSRKQIEDWALGVQMEGFENWSYPYDRILIDEKQGEVVGFWRQVAPAQRPDGSSYECEGVGGSWFRYAGNYQWEWQRDFFDFGNIKSLFMELAAEDKLEPAVKQKIRTLARGGHIPGHVKIRSERSLLHKLKGVLAMIRIVLLGR